VPERGTGEQLKAESALIFYMKWKLAEVNADYAAMKKEWKCLLKLQQQELIQ
jgi:hypothetical protein